MSDTGRLLTCEIAAQQMVDVAFAARIEMTDCDRTYWAMIGQWKSIVITAKTDEEKRSDFLGILQYHIDHLAHAREGQTNAPLRFYADMSVLARSGSVSSVFGQMPAPTLSRTSSRNSSASARTARERGRPMAQAT
jgi:hypothetical protein